MRMWLRRIVDKIKCLNTGILNFLSNPSIYGIAKSYTKAGNSFETIGRFHCSHGRKQNNDSKRNWKPDKDASISMDYKKKMYRKTIKRSRILKYCVRYCISFSDVPTPYKFVLSISEKLLKAIQIFYCLTFYHTFYILILIDWFIYFSKIEHSVSLIYITYDKIKIFCILQVLNSKIILKSTTWKKHNFITLGSLFKWLPIS